MNIKHRDNGKKGAFFIEEDSKEVALMTYTHAGPNKIIIDHTEVNDSLRGQGVGNNLVDVAVEYLRANDLKAIPLCPFVKSVFDKAGEELDDVRA